MASARDYGLLSISPGVLPSLRETLERVVGEQAPAVLQEVGFTSGGEIYDAFRRWLAEESDLDRPEDIDAELLGEVLSNFFGELGWGRVSIERIGSAALAVDASDWIENTAPPGQGGPPVCHFSTGMLAAFFGRLAEDVVAVMEVEPPPAEAGICRFLVGAPETLQSVFDAMSEGADYESVLTASTARNH